MVTSLGTLQSTLWMNHPKTMGTFFGNILNFPTYFLIRKSPGYTINILNISWAREIMTQNPFTYTMGLCKTLPWSTMVEWMYQVGKPQVSWNISHHLLKLGRYLGAPDFLIPVCDGGSNPFVLGAGKSPCSNLSNTYNQAWPLIGKGCTYQSFADNTKFTFHLSDIYSSIGPHFWSLSRPPTNNIFGQTLQPWGKHLLCVTSRTPILAHNWQLWLLKTP